MYWLSSESEDDDEEEDEENENGIFDGVYDPEGIPDYIGHDCNNVRAFNPDDPYNLVPDYVAKTIARRFSGREAKCSIRRCQNTTQYNHAYGIPVFGKFNVLEETMKRACFLIRYSFL